MDLSSKLCRAGVAAGVLLATTAATNRALADDCTTLKNPIFGIGGSAQVPIFAKLGAALAALNPPQTLVYQSTLGACSGVQAIVGGTAITGSPTIWDTTGKASTCTLAVPQPADFGAGGTYANFCPGVTALPAGVADFLGPVQAYDLIVPYASTETTISAEALYFIYGFGGATNPVSPWNVGGEIYKRNTNSGAAIIVSLAIGVPVAKLFGTDAVSNGNTVTLVSSWNNDAAAAQHAIGFVSADVAEGAPAMSVNVLAYQHTGQSCGWWPSSTAQAHDKINVRNGLYALWSPVHFVAAVDSNNTPTSPGAKALIGWFTGKVAPPAGVDIDGLTVSAGAVLDCAMEVQRTTDMGPLLPYAPAAPCGCYFDKTATGANKCTACTTSADCPTSATHCTKGYCEVN